MTSTTRRCLRLLCYTATVTIHLATLMVVEGRKLHAAGDERVDLMIKFQGRYYTSWNFGLQIIHAFLGLTCELLEMLQIYKRDDFILRSLRHTKNLIFTSLIAPSTMFIVTIFWSIYLYDRELIFPSYVDNFLPLTINHIIHTLILPVVLLEMFLLERKVPTSHSTNLFLLGCYKVLFQINLMVTYTQEGFWLYPIYSKLNSVQNIIFTVIAVSTSVFYYYFQWYIVRKIWSTKSDKYE